MLTEQHPLKPLTNDLYAHQQAHELPVTRLSKAAVDDYLAHRFPQRVFPTRLAQVLYRRSGGNPLFLMTMVQELVQSTVLVQADDGLWRIFPPQILD
jgi:predicted ATPase